MKIFNIKKNKKHKIINILGIKIKIKNNTNFDYKYNMCKYMPEEKYPEYLQDWFYEQTGKDLHLDNPQTFNEKIQWMKLYDATPLKTKLADKYLVREWIAKNIGEKYLIPLFGVWENFDDIDFEQLPNKFVLKTNHGSGWNIIVKNKQKFNKEQAKIMLDKWMHTNFAYFGLELHYKDIKPLIIAEKYLETKDNDLKDYKFLCFNGVVKYIWVDKDRYKKHKRNLYDINWNLLPQKISEGKEYDNFESIPKPKHLDEMINLAQKLSQNFKFVRIDFYEHNDNIYFGEITFTSASGLHIFTPDSLNKELGLLINIKE